MIHLTHGSRGPGPQGQTDRLGMALESRRSMHICSLFKDGHEQISQAVPFVMSGLNTNQRCIYILDRNDEQGVMKAMASSRGLVDQMASDQIVFLRKQETYLKNGKFEHKRMLSLIEDAQKQAVADGYSSAIVTGEMTWFCESGTEPESLLEYESRINDLYPGIEANILCQYDETGFDPGLLMEVIRTHPKVLLSGMICSNPYYVPPEDYLPMREGKVSWGVYQRASGEILRRARQGLFVREERSALKKSERRLQTLSDLTLNDLESQLAVTQFYAELALDQCKEQRMWEYISDVVRNCELMQKQLKFASQSLRVGEEDPEWQNLEVVVWNAAMSLGIENLRMNGSVAGKLLCADPMLDRALRGMLEFLATGKDLSVTCSETKDGLVVELASGMKGVPESRKDTIFDRGYRAGERIWYELSLSKSVFETSGCTVRETGEPDKRVRFEILVPRSKYRQMT